MMATISTPLGRSVVTSIRADGIVSRAVETVLSWLARVREREELAALDGRMLHDIGLTRADVYGEFRKPFWRI